MQENPLSKIKKVDCALLPPTRSALMQHLLRSSYVGKLWSSTCEERPTYGLSPNQYGWIENDDGYVPCWFSGPSVPDEAPTTHPDEDETLDTEEELSELCDSQSENDE